MRNRRRGALSETTVLLLALLWMLGAFWLRGPGRDDRAREDATFLFPGQPGAAKTVEARPTSGRRFPDLPIRTLEGEETTTLAGGVPPVVTEFLAFCPDCEASANLFPDLAAKVVAAGYRVTNLAYRGNPSRLRKYLQGRDFGGPVHLDHQGAVQRHFGIGTFTVWLLNPDGTIAYQGRPADALNHLPGHLERFARASQVEDLPQAER